MALKVALRQFKQEMGAEYQMTIEEDEKLIANLRNQISKENSIQSSGLISEQPEESVQLSSVKLLLINQLRSNSNQDLSNNAVE